MRVMGKNLPNLYVARLKENGNVVTGLCRHYTYLKKSIMVCKFLRDNDILEIFAEPASFQDKTSTYQCHISMKQKGTDFWDAYSIHDEKGILEKDTIFINDCKVIEIDTSRDLAKQGDWKQEARKLDISEAIMDDMYP